MKKEEANVVDKAMVARVMVSKLQEEQKPKQIRTRYLKGFESPDNVSIKGDEKKFSPDIMAIYDRETHLYEIELDNKMPVDKWRTFSLYARKNKGNLYLIVPDYLKDPIKEQIRNNDINAGIIYFQT